jgi:hypothetical protein
LNTVGEMEISTAIMENSMEFPKKLETELLCDPGSPSLCINQKAMKPVCQRNVCAPMFIAVVFTIAKKCEQPVSIS